LIVVSKVSVSKEKAKRGAKNTIRFLVHWLGLLAKKKFLIIFTKKSVLIIKYQGFRNQYKINSLEKYFYSLNFND
jgi:hypothetical protein